MDPEYMVDDQNSGGHCEAAEFPAFYLGSWRVEPSRNLLIRAGDSTRLPSKVMQVLVCLATHPDRTVRRDDLLDEVWGDVVVTEAVLSRTISLLRKALHDDVAQPGLIETIPKIGYRLMVQVRMVEHENGSGPALVAESIVEGEVRSVRPEPARKVRPRRRLGWLSLAAPALIMTLIVFFVLARSFNIGFTWRPERNMALEPVLIRPLTSFEGIERDPEFSPDGSQVAYAWNAEGRGQYDLYLQQLEGIHAVRLTHSPDLEISPTWSPDGSRIAFIRSQFENGVLYNRQHIYIIPSSGGEELRLTREPVNIRPGMSWSPDGSWLAIGQEVVPDEPFRIVLLSLKTPDAKLITKPGEGFLGDWWPRFSPDGRRLAFVRASSRWTMDLYMVEIDGTNLTRLTRDDRDITGFCWIDNGEILLSSDRSGSFGLWKIPASANGKEPQWITQADSGKISSPKLAPDHRSLAYELWRYDPNIDLIDLNDPDLTPKPLIFSNREELYPAISPLKNRIAFVSDRTGSFEIWLSDLHGYNQTRLSEFGGPHIGPLNWDPQGKRLTFHVNCGPNGGPLIFTHDIQEQVPDRLSHGSAMDYFPSWSRDGKWIYFGSNRQGDWQIWKMAAQGGSPVQVTRNGGVRAFEAADGFLYYDKFTEPNTGIWKVPVEGGPETRIFTGNHRVFSWFQWVLGKRGIYFTEFDVDKLTELYHLDLESNQVEELGTIKDLDFLHYQSMSLTPEEDQMIFTHTHQRGVDLVLIQNFRL